MTAASERLGPRLGLGVGIDLPWKGPYGIVDGRVAPRTRRFLERHADRFAYLFVSWQPRDRATPRADDYFEVFDALFDGLPYAARALHQTALNLASPTYDRRAILELTNTLVERYGMRWVNEDLGLWSVRGRPLPYPQPPPLTREGIACCTAICRDVEARLAVPLVVEFPGFEIPVPWIHGTLDAFDVFREIVEGADVHCNLDTGHLLTWRWLAGHRGEALLEGLERLPLDRCVEIHCAGTVALDDRLIDAHHGVLLDAQLELASRLMARCPNLRVVTYEDPRFDDQGVLPPAMMTSLDALQARVETWTAEAPPPGEVQSLCSTPATFDDAPWEDDLWSRYAGDDALGHRLRAPLLTRDARGCGRLETMYRASIASALASRDGATIDTLLREFIASPWGTAWSEVAWANPGRCLEDAFGCFVAPASVEHMTACARALVVHPEPPFVIPIGFSRAPAGWFALAGDDDTTLYAALHGRLVTGPVTPLVRDTLRGVAVAQDEAVRDQLVELGLVR